MRIGGRLLSLAWFFSLQADHPRSGQGHENFWEAGNGCVGENYTWGKNTTITTTFFSFLHITFLFPHMQGGIKETERKKIMYIHGRGRRSIYKIKIIRENYKIETADPFCLSGVSKVDSHSRIDSTHSCSYTSSLNIPALSHFFSVSSILTLYSPSL